MDKIDIFFLTKPPHNDRTKLCLHLMEHSQNCILFLAGDGVYNLLEAACIQALPNKRVLACKEDLKARGVQVKGRAIVPDNFYEQLAKDMISEDSKIYAF